MSYHPLTSLKVGGSANFVEIQADGSLIAHGDATTWDDITAGIAAAKSSGPGVSTNDAECTMEFVTSANLSDFAWLPFQIEHRVKAGSTIMPHLHWEQAQNNVPNWLFQYRWQRQGAAKTTAWTSLVTNNLVFTYASGTLGQISYSAGIAAPADYGISDILQLRLLRDTGNASGLFAGADPYTGTASVTSFDIHAECDRPGSRTEYVR